MSWTLFEALHRFGVVAAFLRVADDEARFAAQALEHFHQSCGCIVSSTPARPSSSPQPRSCIMRRSSMS
jgi:hypothetical protein